MENFSILFVANSEKASPTQNSKTKNFFELSAPKNKKFTSKTKNFFELSAPKNKKFAPKPKKLTFLPQYAILLLEVIAIKYILDFSLETFAERLKAISAFPLNNLNSKELKTCIDYVFYGKDADGTSSVDRHEIMIPTKYKSFNRTKDLSLEQLLESPTFNEIAFARENRFLRHRKPMIDRNKDADVPCMKELWAEIDRLEHKIRLVEGKDEPQEGEEIPVWTQKQLYAWRHILIDMRRQQFYLKDSVKPVVPRAQPEPQDPIFEQLDFPIFPCGTMGRPGDRRFTEPWTVQEPFPAQNVDAAIVELESKGKRYFNFLNWQHVYWLILNYRDLEVQAKHETTSLVEALLWTLDFYIDRAGLRPE